MERGWRPTRFGKGVAHLILLSNASYQPYYRLLSQIFADTLVEVVSVESDSVWIHDYHLLVLPSLLRKRFNRIK